ncbi:MAG: pseudouridine-5'-phosphate glycosidase [Phycisphaeraceae bacterium]|nr:MAG: pseudouridine-5'-phosphate glycosidase [Phycisphaeraceae bacterium]
MNQAGPKEHGKRLVIRVPARRAVALETTLLVHGVPNDAALGLHRDLCGIVAEEGATPALVGVVGGVATVGMTEEELGVMLAQGKSVAKANTANLGVLCHWGAHAATTVSATMELATGAGVSVFATGGLGGVHREYGCQLDVSSDLAAFTRFPMCVVASGVKGILDVKATREALETLGVPVIGYQTDDFPAFYQRSSGMSVDARMDDVDSLAHFVRSELARSGRGVLVCQAIPESEEIPQDDFDLWLETAEEEAEDQGIIGRGVTPFVLGRLHEISRGRTLRANLALVRENARLAGRIASRM